MLIQCSVVESSDGGVTKAVNKRKHYVGVASLSVFGGNFVLAKVRRGLISVLCCPRGCPLFGGSAIRGFTVNASNTLSGQQKLECQTITQVCGFCQPHS